MNEFYNINEDIHAEQIELYRTAKANKFKNIESIAVYNLKFHPFINQSGTYTNNAAQIIAHCLKPLRGDNEFIIRYNQEFAKMIREQDLLKSDWEYVTYNVESLFTDV